MQANSNSWSWMVPAPPNLCATQRFLATPQSHLHMQRKEMCGCGMCFGRTRPFQRPVGWRLSARSPCHAHLVSHWCSKRRVFLSLYIPLVLCSFRGYCAGLYHEKAFRCLYLDLGEKRNWLVQHATGDYVAHFDDDDYYAPHYISRMVSQILELDVVFIKRESLPTSQPTCALSIA